MKRIGIVGAGAMGSGIAQLAATAGHPVVLADAGAGVAVGAQENLARSLGRMIEKGRLDASARDATLGRIRFVGEPLGASLQVFRECDVVIEAIVEDIDAKRALFQKLDEMLPPPAILATNTSSLSVGAIAAACRRPERVLGIHFFNPAPVMPLVEIVPALATDGSVVDSARELVSSWQKTPVLATDTPGFIVNRIARPFYGEALRILEERIADVATIDWAMREIGKFRMGPFELMDFIGNDVNYAVTRSVFEGFFHDPRYKPSLTQRRLVDAGFLGRKAGRGYYDYRQGSTAPSPRTDLALGTAIVDRILAMLINEAADALYLGVASARDIDLAMTKGVNYPRGLLAWADELGVDRVLRTLTALLDEYAEDRYRPSPLLKRLARDGGRFHV